MYWVSKIIWLAAEPGNLLMLTLIAGIMLSARERFARLGNGLIIAATALLLLLGLSPIGTLMLRPLEARFPVYGETGAKVDGILVLGGVLATDVTLARGQPALNEAAERLTILLPLTRQFPEARIVFSGGAGEFTGAPISESEAVQTFVAEMMPGRAVIYERNSRNTFENARLSFDQIRPKPEERWLLVTSAWHMPRAYGLLRKVGWPVVAYPVDFRTSGTSDDYRVFSGVSQGLRRVDMAAKEWIGLVFARLAGQSDSLLPGPE
ncbi:MAG TPA: YdcF family protein [Beijerinckiaceae bacterium]|nr:YdcF family protein [Beijerinckiaceae bacterium]